MPFENLISLIDALSSDINQIKVDNGKISTQLEQVDIEVGDIKEDRRRSGEKYQLLLQRITKLESTAEQNTRDVEKLEQKYDNTFQTVETRINEAVKGVEKRLQKTVEDIEKRLQEKIKEIVDDKRFWFKTIVTSLISIGVTLLLSHFMK